jgi:putative transposase
LKKSIKGICERYWFSIDEIGTDWDHVHIFVWATPKRSPLQVMQTLKSITAKAMFKQFPEIKKILRWGSFRSDWWYIWTVWEWTNEDIVKKYIRNQWDEIEKQQHKEISLFKLT